MKAFLRLGGLGDDVLGRHCAAHKASAADRHFLPRGGAGRESDVGSQGSVELCEALDQLLKLRPLLGVQGPATGHHSKPVVTWKRVRPVSVLPVTGSVQVYWWGGQP